MPRISGTFDWVMTGPPGRRMRRSGGADKQACYSRGGDARGGGDGRGRQGAGHHYLQGGGERRGAIFDLAGRSRERARLAGRRLHRPQGRMPRLYRASVDRHAPAQPAQANGRSREGRGRGGPLAQAMETLASACRAILLAAEPAEKMRRARAAARAWRRGELAHAFDAAMPGRPARPARPELLAPSFMPKRGRGGSERGRIAMLHALAHIEFVAIDLAFDLVGRFGGGFPREFADDWLGVGADEAMHFALLDRRLKSLGSGYGALPAHAGLWEAAEATA